MSCLRTRYVCSILEPATVRSRFAPTLLITVSGVLALAISALLWQWTSLYSSAGGLQDVGNRIKARSELLDTATKVLGGLLIITTLWSTWRSLRLSRESHTTESYVSAIEMLADPNSEAKQLGGVFALERLARDSTIDRWIIVEVLSAVVRTSILAEQKGEKASKYSRRVVQAVVALLGRFPSSYYAGAKRLDLRGADLRALDLTGVQLDRVDLRNAKLDEAILKFASLREALLTNTSLVDADCSEAIYERAVMNNAALAKANFYKARMRDAEMRSTQLTDASFAQADLTGVSLDEARLERCTFTNAQLSRAKILRANVRDAIFQGAQVDATDFAGTDTSEALHLHLPWKGTSQASSRVNSLERDS